MGSVEIYQTGIPREVLLEFLYKQSKADGLTGRGRGGTESRMLDLYSAFIRDQMLNKGRSKAQADMLWSELGKMPKEIKIPMLVDNSENVEDPRLVRTFGTMEPISEELQNQAASNLLFELFAKANRNPFPGTNATRHDVHGGDFGDFLRGLSWLTPFGASVNIASKIAGGKRAKKAPAKKAPAKKAPAAKKKPRQLSGGDWIDDVGQVFSFLTPWGASAQAIGALSQL
jgi:hypothetical protein